MQRLWSIAVGMDMSTDRCTTIMWRLVLNLHLINKEMLLCDLMYLADLMAVIKTIVVLVVS